MAVEAIVGANWGDEGKGKITDFLAGQADMVVRFQGGRNAGHTIINSFGKFALHLLPSGVFYPEVVNVLATGVALEVSALLAELKNLVQRGVPEPRLVVSDRAQVIMPYHILFDRYEEERLAAEMFGSTQSGIAPFYADKYLKLGIQVADLYDEDYVKTRIDRSLAAKNVLLEHLYGKSLMSVDRVLNNLLEAAERLRPFVGDTSSLLNEASARGKRILLEGQLGALRDPDHGIYPYSTSSSTLAGFASVGAGIPPQTITRVVAVTKAYSTCVGAGPFATEIFGRGADALRERGGDAGEYGATTGRPRRVGYFDAVATRYGCRLQGATEMALSCLDVLGYLDEIPVCKAYEIDGRPVEDFPPTVCLAKARPVYEVLPGWKCDISGIDSFDDLPVNAQKYVRYLEKATAYPIGWISTGPHRDALFRISE
ncbi:MAG: adenylosuccinate synthase [Proteobacteria bacterium]|nr:adenylosuccinate synthase [Pseudomonadota bacterium]